MPGLGPGRGPGVVHVVVVPDVRTSAPPGDEPVEILTPSLCQRPPVGDPGVVDQDVQPAELPDHSLHDRSSRGRLAQVRLDREYPAAEGAYLGGHLLGTILARVIGKADVGSLRGQSAHDLRPDPAAAAGDHRDLAGQPVRELHHGPLLRRFRRLRRPG
jgi:hypothetical protein